MFCYMCTDKWIDGRLKTKSVNIYKWLDTEEAVAHKEDLVPHCNFDMHKAISFFFI
jgi:hypothetical protein